MAEIKWIKLATEVFDNRKIKQIECLPDGDAILVIWFKLLCLAGVVNDKGFIYFTQEVPYTEQMLSVQFNRPLPVVQMALKVFEEFGMVQIIDNILCISNWEKYQNVEGMDKVREQTRKRVAKHRSNQKLLTSDECNVTVTLRNATDKDIDKEKDIEKDIYKNIVGEKSKRFVPPTVEEVKTYCQERNNNIDAEEFVDFYESKGWFVGKNKMKDWKACVRTWEKSSKRGNNDGRVRANERDIKSEVVEDCKRLYGVDVSDMSWDGLENPFA